MKITKVITDSWHKSFDSRVNQLTEEGWRIIPETFKIGVSSTSNAWKAEAQVSRVFGVVLEKDL